MSTTEIQFFTTCEAEVARTLIESGEWLPVTRGGIAVKLRTVRPMGWEDAEERVNRAMEAAFAS